MTKANTQRVRVLELLPVHPMMRLNDSPFIAAANSAESSRPDETVTPLAQQCGLAVQMRLFAKPASLCVDIS